MPFTDVEKLRSQLANQTNRLMEWRNNISQEINLLQEESALNGDIYFADMVDVYRNIPQKLLKFFNWYGLHGFIHRHDL